MQSDGQDGEQDVILPGPLLSPSPTVGLHPWPLRYDELQKRAVSATQPYSIPINNEGDYGATDQRLSEPAPSKRAFGSWNITLSTIAANLLLAPFVFGYVSSVFGFWIHYRYPRCVWVLASFGVIPLVVAMLWRRKAQAQGVNTRWQTFLVVTVALAFVSAGIFAEVNYWHFMHPFYTLRAMKSYSSINPAEVSGQRLMDAAQVQFTEDARLITDLSMSYTDWDIYCVAPISTSAGMPSQGGRLSSYDFWAVGVNCCRSGGDPSFSCGHYRDTHAHSALRLADEEQVSYFRIAVQQAEAAYGIRAAQPIFFYWVQDAAAEEGLFFETGFKNWIFAASAHFGFNVLLFTLFLMMFHQPNKSSYLNRL